MYWFNLTYICTIDFSRKKHLNKARHGFMKYILSSFAGLQHMLQYRVTFHNFCHILIYVDECCTQNGLHSEGSNPGPICRNRVMCLTTKTPFPVLFHSLFKMLPFLKFGLIIRAIFICYNCFRQTMDRVSWQHNVHP